MNFQQELVAHLPVLRVFAHGLCGRAALADDLTQGTALRALERSHQYQKGTNMRAWLFTILRNQYYSMLRKDRRFQELDDAIGAQIPAADNQNDAVDFEDMRRALFKLPAQQRDAICVFAFGDSYEAAARKLGCAMGTLKSRAHRGRQRLQELLEEPAIAA